MYVPYPSFEDKRKYIVIAERYGDIFGYFEKGDIITARMSIGATGNPNFYFIDEKENTVMSKDSMAGLEYYNN
jgi:hypothetical protein